MLDTEMLKATLERVAREGQDTDLGHPQECLARVLDAVDAVVLPRDITLDNGADQSLSLTIKARRLIRVNGPVPRVLGALPGVVNEELRAMGDQPIALAHLLTAFSAYATRLSISACEPAHPEYLTELGLSGADIRRGLEAAGYVLPTTIGDAMAALEKVAQDHAAKWVKFDDQAIVATSGEVHEVRRLWDEARVHLVKTERPPSKRVSVWLLGTGAGLRTGIALKGQTCLIAQLPLAATRAWITASKEQ